MGTVKLALTIPPNGPSVTAVDWHLMSVDGTIQRSGTIQTGDINATPSVELSVAQGAGFRIVLTATASDSSSCYGVSDPFNVSGGGTVTVTVQLVCGGGNSVSNGGTVIINGNVVAGDNCPLLTSWEVASLRSGSFSFGNISVSATASDADPGDVLSYQWTATGGAFGNPYAAVTSYTCGLPGRVDLSVIVSDGHQPTPCTTARSFSAFCSIIGLCGNGIVEPGEQCDPPNGLNCTASCQLTTCGNGVVDPGETCDPPSNACNLNCQHPTCGNSIIEPGEECDPPSSPGCNSTCHLAVCGDGVVASGEECDPPNGTTCRPGCIAARCGDGVVDPGETCDPPNGTTCSSTCRSGPPGCGVGPFSACDLCEQAATIDCSPPLLVVPGATCTWGCSGYAAGSAARTHCAALLSCITSTHCMAGDDPTPCLCGAQTPPSCATMGPPASAPCLAQYIAAAADAPGDVYTQFFNPSSPVGIANNVAACDYDSACNCR